MVRGSITLLVHDILVGVLRVLEEIANWLGEAANLPIAQLYRWVLLILLFATSSSCFRFLSVAHLPCIFLSFSQLTGVFNSLVLRAYRLSSATYSSHSDKAKKL